MIDLRQSASASPLLHVVPSDPGINWIKEASAALDAAPDAVTDPLPDEQWGADELRTGVYGVVSPRVVVLPGGGFRMYYSQMMPRPGFPEGANDYDNATTRILSATSPDGSHWTPEPGVRLSPHDGGAGEFRVVSSEVVPLTDGGGVLRMYYECCRGPQTLQNSIRSAVSTDGGLQWNVEAGARYEASGGNVSAPRLVFLEDGRCRLYVCLRGEGIISALSADGGLTFQREAGCRIAQDGPFDRHAAFAPEIVRIAGGGYRMYYAGYSSPRRADILTATSADGIEWHKAAAPVISPDGVGCDAAKSSEMCLIPLHGTGEAPRYRMFYEACDGTARDRRGVWRIASAVSAD